MTYRDTNKNGITMSFLVSEMLCENICSGCLCPCVCMRQFKW